MSIKFADEIAKEIKERGQIQVPDGCVTGEEFEKWRNSYETVCSKWKLFCA